MNSKLPKARLGTEAWLRTRVRLPDCNPEAPFLGVRFAFNLQLNVQAARVSVETQMLMSTGVLHKCR